LPRRGREALVLFAISDLSIKEIQEIQGGTASGVKSRMSRARVKLKELLLDADSVAEFEHPGIAALGQPGIVSQRHPGRARQAPGFLLQDA
ncbi:MAG TPA: sigma factor-like helix-turn-helix DNA-binding protein, partial [Candidatus Kapabacteria bacterium]|nr:sigma factor-like helix-turn-helix DNA-binding protein [Candidatus Kapabacteria bacterium]